VFGRAQREYENSYSACVKIQQELSMAFLDAARNWTVADLQYPQKTGSKRNLNYRLFPAARRRGGAASALLRRGTFLALLIVSFTAAGESKNTGQ
jgi:hypothetical protein